MNSVIVAKTTKSVIPSFKRGELVTCGEWGIVVLVTSVRNDTYFNGVIVFSTQVEELGKDVVYKKVDFELFNEVLELAN